MTKDKALKLALDLLKNAHACTAQDYDNAIKALEAALAQPVQPDIESAITELPKREWVGLTDRERHDCTQSAFSDDNHRAIEAKLKERNS
jgi:hypothetical protein